jgi:glycosyltransferase involved in cell wall biosynthesis
MVRPALVVLVSPCLDARVSEHTPALSIGLAVRNEPHAVKRCIESILSQDFADLELVICDNASDDCTVETLERYAHADRRITLCVNEDNIGSQENMKRVLQLARGTFFRWISADDWLEPTCLSACAHALQGRPNAVGVTTWFTIHAPDAAPRYEEYRGEFPTSPDPVRRFERMLWFFHAGDAKYDPIYGMYRRDCLMRSHPLRPSERADWHSRRPDSGGSDSRPVGDRPAAGTRMSCRSSRRRAHRLSSCFSETRASD